MKTQLYSGHRDAKYVDYPLKLAVFVICILVAIIEVVIFSAIVGSTGLAFWVYTYVFLGLNALLVILCLTRRLKCVNFQAVK